MHSKINKKPDAEKLTTQQMLDHMTKATKSYNQELSTQDKLDRMSFSMQSVNYSTANSF